MIVVVRKIIKCTKKTNKRVGEYTESWYRGDVNQDI